MGKVFRGYRNGDRKLPRRRVPPAGLCGPILFGMTSSWWSSERPLSQQTYGCLSSRQRCSAAIFGWLMVVALIGCENTSAGEMPVAADKDGALRIRMVEIPQEEMRNVPVGDLTYLPVKRTKFEQLIQEISEGATRPAGTLVRIDRAIYFAQLGNDQLVNGIGQWDINQGAKYPVTLSLDNIQLPLRRPRWDGADKNRIVKLGLSPNGGLAALIDRTGTLLFDWTLAGQRETGNVIRFDLQLAPCPANELILELPRGLLPMVSHGLVQGPLDRSDIRLDCIGRALQSRRADPLSGSTPTDGQRSEVRSRPLADQSSPSWDQPENDIWHIELGGRHQATLHLLPEWLARDRRRMVLARQSNRFTINEYGLELAVEIRFDARYQPLRQVQLEMDSDLCITAAEFQGKAVPWSVESAAGDEPGFVVIDFTEPVRGQDMNLRLAAFAPRHGTPREQLPFVRPRSMFWQEGTAEIRVEKPLEVTEVRFDGCQPLAPLHRSPADEADVLRFDLFHPTPVVEVALAPRIEEVHVRQGTTVRFGESSLVGRTIADFRCLGGERYGLTARIPEHWAIDSIDSEPPDAIADWALNPSTTTRQLRIRLKHSLQPEDNPRLIISGHHPALLVGDRLGRGDLCFVQFEQVDQEDHQVALSSDAPHVLKWDGDPAWRGSEADELSDEQRSRLDAVASQLVFADDEYARSLSVWMSAQESQFSVEIRTEISAGLKRVREVHRIRVEPMYVDRLRVRFSLPETSPTRWMVLGEPETSLDPQRLSDGDSESPLPDDTGEIWEVALRRPRRTPFELHAIRSSPFKPGTRISLLSVTNAEQQTGTVMIRVTGNQDVLIENHRLQSIPAEVAQVDRQTSLRAVFRYDPSPHAVVAAPHALSLSPAVLGSDHARFWLLRRDVDSDYSANGFSRHRVTYELENHASRQLRLTPHVEGTIRKITLNSADVTAGVTTRNGNLLVDLPAGAAPVTLAIELEHQRAPLRLFDSLLAPIPAIDAPCLASQWRITLPPGYESSDRFRFDRPRSRGTWRHRLFGSWARDDGRTPFYPLRRRDWIDLAETITGFESESSLRDHARLSIGLPLDSDFTPRRTVHDAKRLNVVGWACLFAMATAVSWLARSASQLWPVMVAVCAAVALLVPLALVPVFSRIFLGALLGGAIIIIRSARHQPSSPPDIPSTGPSTIRRTLTITLLWAAVGMPSLDCQAQTTRPPRSASGNDQTYQVFIPVDEEGRVTGEYYSVPDPVYQALRHFEEQSQHTAPDWIIYRTVYRTRLDWEIPDKRLVMDLVTLICDLETFGPNRLVRLSLRESELQLVDATARLDDRSIPIHWTDEGNALELLIPKTGTYRLELTLLPRQSVAEPFGKWSFGIPRVPDSTFVIDLPPDPPSLELPGLGGAVYWDGQRLRAELGTRDRITVQWSEGNSVSFSRTIDVEQMFWLKVQPRSVVLDAKMTFRVTSGKLRMIQLIADSRLRMLPLDDSSPIRHVHYHDSHASQRLLLELREPVDDVLTIDTSFLVTDTSGIGRITFPRVETGGTITRRWLAVSGHENFEVAEASSNLGTRVTGPEFVRAWGGIQVEPPQVYDLTSKSFMFPVIAVQPAPTDEQIAQRLTMVYGEDRAELRFDADVQTGRSARLEHRIAVGNVVTIDEVLLSDADHSIAARWFRSDAGSINVYLNQWHRAPYRLTIRGHVPVVPGEPSDFPVVGMMESTIETDRVIVGRQSGVSVSWDPTREHDSAELRPDETLPLEAARIVGAWEVDRTQPFAKVIVNRNEPLTSSVQVSSLVRREEGWFLEVDHEITVESGFLDELAFDVPRLCGAPLQVKPNLVVNASAGTEPGRRRLIFHLPATMQETFRLQFHLPLTFAAGQRIHVPHINPLDQPDCTHYVVLPHDDGLHTTVWDTPWLRTSRLPARFEQAVRPAREYDDGIYVAIDRDFRAEQRPADDKGGVPKIRQADIRVYQQAADSGEYSGRASFDLEPTGRDRCSIKLPVSLRLIHAKVGGLPARVRRVGEIEWEVALVSTWLPQRIEMEYTGVLSPALFRAPSVRFQAPELVGIDVQQTLWTVSAPSSVVIGNPYDKEHRISRSRQQFSRLKAMTELMDLSAHVVGEQTAKDVTNWYRIWAGRYRGARDQFTILQDGSTSTDELTAIESQQSQIAAHLGTQSHWEALTHGLNDKDVGEAGDRYRALPADVEVGAHTVTSMFQGSRYSVKFSAPFRSPIVALMRYVAAALLMIWVWWASRRIPLPWARWVTLCARWPAFHGMLIGIIWWLWLVPSWLGLVIAAMGLLAAIGVDVLTRWSQTRYRIILQRRS